MADGPASNGAATKQETPPTDVKRVAVVGAGVIGSSWATLFLASGMDVVVSDPAPKAEAAARKFVDEAWPERQKIGLRDGASKERLSFVPDFASALSGVSFVQENGPEREDFKIKMFATMDEALPPDVVIASSSSGLSMSRIQSGCKHPERCIIGHPFNPPHIIPLVEVVGGEKTSGETIQWALDFYAAVGKRPIHVRKEVPGHVANRLQTAVWREAVYLIEQGVVSVADLDAAMTEGPGLRWAIDGPNMTWNLAGGAGGFAAWWDKLSGPTASWWPDLGNPKLSLGMKDMLVKGVDEEAAGRSVASLAAERDRLLVKIIAAKAEEAAHASKPA